jgi:hypothetical protein
MKRTHLNFIGNRRMINEMSETTPVFYWLTLSQRLPSIFTEIRAAQ